MDCRAFELLEACGQRAVLPDKDATGAVLKGGEDSNEVFTFADALEELKRIADEYGLWCLCVCWGLMRYPNRKASFLIKAALLCVDVASCGSVRECGAATGGES